MAKKKRRDSKRDPSTAKRVLKAGGAVLAVGAGAALFSRSGLLKKASDVLPALRDTTRTFNKEMLNKKATAMNLYNAYNKSVGPRGTVLKQTLKNRKTLLKEGKEALKYNPSTSRLTNILGQRKHIRQVSNVESLKYLERKQLMEIQQGAKKGIKKRVAEGKYKKKYDDEVIDDIVEKTIAKYKEITDKDGKVSTNFLKRTKEYSEIDDDDLYDIVSRVSESARIGMDPKKISKLRRESVPLSKDIERIHLEDLKKRTRSNKLINKIGKKILGVDNMDDIIFGSHQATLKEVLDNLEKLGIDEDEFEEVIKNRVRTKGRENEHFFNAIKDWQKLNKESKGAYDDIIFDANLRVKTTKDGLEFMDLTESREIIDNFMDDFNSTIIGRVLTKGIDRKGMKNAPKSYMLLPDLKSAAARFQDDVIDNRLKDPIYVINNTAYKMYYDDTSIERGYRIGEELGKGHSINMRHGSFSGVLKSLLGSTSIDPTNSKNSFMQMLDLGQSGRPSIFERAYQWFHKFENPDWGRNQIDDVMSILFTEGDIESKIAQMATDRGLTETDVKAHLYESFKTINNLFKSKSSQAILDDNALAMLQENIDVLVRAGNFGPRPELLKDLEKVNNLINVALDKSRPEDILDSLLDLQANGMIIKSDTLSNLLDRYTANAAETLELISIEARSSKKVPILSMELPETNVENISGIIRREVLKEITTEEDVMRVAKHNLNFSDSDWEAYDLLEQWQRWQSATTSSDADNLFTALFAQGGSVDNYLLDLQSSPLDLTTMYNITNEFKADFGILHKGSFEGIHENYAFEYNTYDFISESRLSWKNLKEINNWTKFKAAMKEFNGGRRDTGSISPVTLVTQYMINRLSMGVEDVGLALSDNSTSSPLNTIKNLMLKRVMPAMAAFTAFDYLNDLSQDVTGVGITGAMANTVANMDVLSRGIAYKTGIGQGIDWFKRTSVMAEYWTGSTDFQTAEERKEWYEDGYSPVRKSRFWGFGSSSEFRGGDITFFQPNYLRRIHSDYKDKVIYGSNSEKWAHSIIPTPTHPFSTIRYLMDPYWLERKHVDDAPTPLTGKMFSEGSLWGAVLNPTIGEVIKPQIMLPEIKKRLTKKGHDSKGIVRRINERIKRKANEYDDMLIVNGTDIRNATYVPYGNATPGTITVNQYGEIRGIDYMNKVQDLGRYRTPDGTTYTEKSGGGFGPPVTRRMEDDGYIKNTIDDFLYEFGTQSGISSNVIENLNNAIKNKSRKQRGRGRQGGPSFAAETPNRSSEGTFIYNNLVNEYNNWVAQHYSDVLDPAMVNTNKYGDYLTDIKHSAKNLSGIYGFLGEQFFGEDSYTLRYENAGVYSSFSRGFWDAGIGGLGGGTMEIARRFFPSSDKSRIDYNPLVNNMPEWLPDKFKTGVAWTKITKGEMRLPGKGYEALNELHPDEFADENGYGSFDKFKILADVAPNSNEYKIWHNIVKHNIKDPELKAEIKEIEARTKRMAGSHEFYDYQYLHTGTSYEKGVVKTINQDGTVTLANNQILTLAGIELNENYGGEIGNFIKPGQHIIYRTETAVNDPTGEGVIRRAAIYTNKHGDTLSKQLMDMGVAERDMSDTSAIGNLATISSTQETWGAVQEIIAHARIPIFHNKLMHVESPLEAFISEQVHGANFQTWDHPIESHVKPMLNEVAGQSIIRRGAARLYREFHFNKVLTKSSQGFMNKATKFGSGAVLATLDPAAMLGGTLTWMLRLNNGRNGDGRQKLGAFSKGAKLGGTLGDAYWAWSQADDPLSGAVAFGALAADVYRKFELKEFSEKVLKKGLDMKGAIAIGAGIGLGVSALKNADFDKDRLFNKHMPKKYRKINEMNEYFDRLEYIKYKGLYEAASRKAALLEGANVKEIFRNIDRNKKKIAKLKQKAEKLLKKYDEGDSEYKAEMARIQRKIDSLQESGNNVFKGGKYTKSAVAYKKAMESTIYGLKPGATKDEILAAVPDQYKDYFQKFMDVRDPKERKKILRYMPEYLQRPLQMAWGMKLNDVQSNRKYFKSHKLPGVGWRGWKPNINLRHVQMKTVQNEGMILSDFGFYESEKGKAAYTVAPDIEDYDKPSGGSMFSSLRLMAEMKGLGLGLTNVSIDRTSAPGMWVSADIKQSITDRTELATNSMSNMLQGLAANFF